jgi:hypothetical protein
MEVRPRQGDLIAIEPRGRSDRASNGGPEAMPIGRLPRQAEAGLKFEAGVVVVLDPGAEGHVQRLLQRQFILGERAERLEVRRSVNTTPSEPKSSSTRR